LRVDGIDPSAENHAAGKTFETVAREGHVHWMANRHQRHAHYVLKRLEADIFPEIGRLPLSEIPTSAFRVLPLASYKYTRVSPINSGKSIAAVVHDERRADRPALRRAIAVRHK
jgi:hypothetical protein